MISEFSPATRGSKCRAVGLARANAYGVLHFEDEYFTVPDLAGLRSRSNGLDGSVGELTRHCQLNLDLWHKAYCIFGPAIELAVPSLAPVPLDLGRCHSWNSDRIEGIADLFELEWLDDCDDELHECTSWLTDFAHAQCSDAADPFSPSRPESSCVPIPVEAHRVKSNNLLFCALRRAREKSLSTTSFETESPPQTQPPHTRDCGVRGISRQIPA